MGIKQTLSNGLKSFGRIQVSQGAMLTYTALLLILFVAFTIRVLPMRWEIPAGTLGLNEFDPYYQYSLTNYMVNHGLLSPYWPTEWINYQQFYPAGLNMAYSYPALPATTAVLYGITSFLGVNIDLVSFCSLMAPILGTVAVFVLYFLAKDMGGKTVGLLAALVMALSPSVIQRSSLGFFDTETTMFSMLLCIIFFLRAIDDRKSLKSLFLYSIAAALSLAYFALGWGSQYFLIDLIALFAVVLILIKRYTPRLLISYSILFGIGLFIAIMLPVHSPTYLTEATILPVAGVFVLLCLAELLRVQISARTKTILAASVLVLLVAVFVAIATIGDITSIAGKFASVLDPYQRASQPLIESVAEHRITAWGSMYYELGISILFFLMGLYFTIKHPTNRNVFLLVFGVTTVYFASSMVRLLVLLAPAFAILVALGVVGLLKPFYTLLKEARVQATMKSKRSLRRVGKEYGAIAILLVFLMLMSTFAFSPQTGGEPRVYTSVYNPITISAASLPITPYEPIPEWRNMLSYTQSNLKSTDVVACWWDYGDWLGMSGNVTTLCDNTTVNATQIENVAYAMMANENQSCRMLSYYDTDYILVFPVLQMSVTSEGSIEGVQLSGYGDEGKWSWMARISGEAQARFMTDETFGTSWMSSSYSWRNETSFGNTTTDETTGASEWTWNDMGLNSTIFKLMSYAEQLWANQNSVTVLDQTAEVPSYFTAVYISGLDITPSTAYYSYGSLIPLVALYQIDWDAYYAANGSTTS